MKKKLVLILSVVMVVALVFSLSACGKTVQKIAEKAIEDAVGENIANEDTAGEDTAGEDTEVKTQRMQSYQMNL